MACSATIIIHHLQVISNIVLLMSANLIFQVSLISILNRVYYFLFQSPTFKYYINKLGRGSRPALILLTQKSKQQKRNDKNRWRGRGWPATPLWGQKSNAHNAQPTFLDMKKNLGKKEILVKKKMYVQKKNWVWKIFGPKKNVGPKNFGSEKMLDQKLFLSLHSRSSKVVFHQFLIFL